VSVDRLSKFLVNWKSFELILPRPYRQLREKALKSSVQDMLDCLTRPRRRVSTSQLKPSCSLRYSKPNSHSCLSDVQESIRTYSERAFAHLQRSIVADEEIQRKWLCAFGKGEVACEKLGGVDLLSHGIWAFKVDARGARTDLVFQDSDVDLARSSATQQASC
jgi:hypothetical protein